MKSAYEVLEKAAKKSFGDWQTFKWSWLTDEAQQKTKTGELAEVYWQDTFLHLLSHLFIRTEENPCICGRLDGGKQFESVVEENVDKLNSQFFDDDVKYWVYASFSFDYNFMLHGYKNKAEAMKHFYYRKKKMDNIFRVIMFRW